MKLLGHPIHPLMIHFPTALLPMDFVLSLLSHLKNDPSFSLAGFYCLFGGVLFGFAALLTGLIELIYIPKTNKQALATGLYHGFVNGIVILVFAVMAYQGWKSYPQTNLPTIIIIAIKGILNLTLFIGNYMGGRLIYKYHIGLNINPKEHGNLTS